MEDGIRVPRRCDVRREFNVLALIKGNERYIFVYDEESGAPEEGLAPGTRWADVADDWVCPLCGTPKSDFDMVEL